MNDDLIREGDKGYRRLYELWHEERERLYDPVRRADGSISKPLRIPDSDEQTDKITMEKYGFHLLPDDYSKEWIKDAISPRIVRAVFQVTDKPKYVREIITKLEEGEEVNPIYKQGELISESTHDNEEHSFMVAIAYKAQLDERRRMGTDGKITKGRLNEVLAKRFGFEVMVWANLESMVIVNADRFNATVGKWWGEIRATSEGKE